MNEQLELLQTIPGVGKDGAIYESMVGRRGEKKAFFAIGHIIWVSILILLDTPVKYKWKGMLIYM